jgi:hypothetical protein
MGRVIYSYDEKYSITGTVRSDGASVLAPGNQVGNLSGSIGGMEH